MSKKLNRREVLVGAGAAVAAAALPIALPREESLSVFDWLEKIELEAVSLKDLRRVVIPNSVSDWWDEAETEGFRKAWSRPPIPLEPENPADLDRNVAES